MLLCASAITFASDTPHTRRSKYNFNADWKVFVGDQVGADRPEFDDTGWKSVTLPHVWNEDDAFGKDLRDLPTGIAWYR